MILIALIGFFSVIVGGDARCFCAVRDDVIAHNSRTTLIMFI